MSGHIFRQLRNACGLTQMQAAEKSNRLQSEISRLERAADCNVSTLIKYAAALGARLEFSADFPNGKTLSLMAIPSDLPTPAEKALVRLYTGRLGYNGSLDKLIVVDLLAAGHISEISKIDGEHMSYGLTEAGIQRAQELISDFGEATP